MTYGQDSTTVAIAPLDGAVWTDRSLAQLVEDSDAARMFDILADDSL